MSEGNNDYATDLIKMISIGNGCYVRHVIENNYYKHKIETNFFDWLLSSMNSVNQVFQSISSLEFDACDFSIDIDSQGTASTYRTNFNNFGYLISIHDTQKNLPQEEALKIVAEKYNRRLRRLFSHVKNSEKLIFVRYSAPEIMEIELFFDYLYKINRLCHYRLLVFDSGLKLSNHGYNYDVMYVNVEKFRITGVAHQTWLPEYDWNAIFDRVRESPFYCDWNDNDH